MVKNARTNRPLSTLSLAFTQEYESTLAAPVVRVSKPTGFFYKWDKATFFRDIGKPVSFCAEPDAYGAEVEPESYQVKKYAADYKFCDEEVEANDDEIDERRAGVEMITRGLMVGREARFAKTFLSPGSAWTNKDVVAAADRWDQGGNPITMGFDKVCQIKRECGIKPNLAVIDHEAYCCLKNNDFFLERILGGANVANPAMGTRDLLAMLWDVDRVIVADASVYNNETGAIESVVKQPSVLFTYVAAAPGRRVTSSMFNFVWDRFGVVDGVAIREIRDEDCDSTKIRGYLYEDMRIVAPDLGYLCLNVCGPDPV